MTLDFETKLTYTYGIAVASTVLAGLWIVWILIQIEVNKSFMTMDIDNPLELDVEDEINGPQRVEMEASEGGTDNKDNSAPETELSKQPRRRRVQMSFKFMQFTSVGVLILLTYLLLVVSSASLWLSTIGSLCVLGIFLRYQIGDELRRKRLDRLCLIISLFMVIAGSLSMATYAQKTRNQGEIYQGPARIVAYDGGNYNQNAQDPVSRTDLTVSWGKSWGCPKSGGKVCQAHVEGAMCQAGPPTTSTSTGTSNNNGGGNRRALANTNSTSSSGSSGNNNDTNTTKNADDANAVSIKSSHWKFHCITLHSRTRTNCLTHSFRSSFLASILTQDLEEDLEDEEKTAEELQEENDALAAQNEELEQEVEDLTAEEADEEIIAAEDEEIYYEDAEEVTEEAEEIYNEEVEAVTEEAEEDVEDIKEVADEGGDVDAEAEDIEESMDGDEELEEEYGEEIDEAYESYDEEVEGILIDEEDEEIEQEEEEEDGVGEGEYGGWDDDAYQWDYTSYNYEFDDDYYENEYWGYDWSSAWGDYGYVNF
jgi:hypothetical protein